VPGVFFPEFFSSISSYTICQKSVRENVTTKWSAPQALDCCDSSFTALNGGFVLRDDGLLSGYFVFPSRTQKAAEKNRSSQKPPAI
jgi:hypothetical protein